MTLIRLSPVHSSTLFLDSHPMLSENSPSCHGQAGGPAQIWTTLCFQWTSDQLGRPKAMPKFTQVQPASTNGHDDSTAKAACYQPWKPLGQQHLAWPFTAATSRLLQRNYYAADIPLYLYSHSHLYSWEYSLSHGTPEAMADFQRHGFKMDTPDAKLTRPYSSLVESN